MADLAESNEPKRGKVDGTAVLYIAGGIPAIVGFLAVFFLIGVRYCGLPG
jgi:hypothetical protein